MAEVENTMDILTKIVVDARIAGHTFEEIAAQQNISVDDVVLAWREYVDTRMVMSKEEQWVLHLLRLENFLVKANERLNYATRAEDFELVLKLLDRIEALMALNETRKTEADAALTELTKAQTQIILGAMLRLQAGFKAQLEEAFNQGRTIKTIKGTVLDNFDETFLELAQTALTEAPQE